MVSKLTILVCTLAVLQQMTSGFVVEVELQQMKNDVSNQTVQVTSYAANENPNTLTEEAEIAEIIGKHIKNFDNYFGDELKVLLQAIETGRQQAGINSPRGLCLKLQETKLDPVRAQGEDRATDVQADVDKHVSDLVENTRTLIEQTKLDLQVKTIVQLCMKLYTNIGQDKQRLACFDEYGADLTIEQKSRGEGLLERVGTTQQQSMRIADRADSSLRQMYAQNEIAYTTLNTNVQKCMTMPANYMAYPTYQRKISYP